MGIATAAIITKENKILLVKRAREPYKNFWSLVGGTGAFRYTWNPKKAAKLEVKGDLNCNLENPKFFTYSLSNGYLTLFYHGQIKGKIKLNKKYNSEYKWFTKEEIKKLNLAFDSKEILKKLKNQSNLLK